MIRDRSKREDIYILEEKKPRGMGLSTTQASRALARQILGYEKESRFWAIVHNVVAHPLCALPYILPFAFLERWTDSFHAWTSDKAWK